MRPMPSGVEGLHPYVHSGQRRTVGHDLAGPGAVGGARRPGAARQRLGVDARRRPRPGGRQQGDSECRLGEPVRRAEGLGGQSVGRVRGFETTKRLGPIHFGAEDARAQPGQVELRRRQSPARELEREQRRRRDLGPELGAGLQPHAWIAQEVLRTQQDEVHVLPSRASRDDARQEHADEAHVVARVAEPLFNAVVSSRRSSTARIAEMCDPMAGSVSSTPAG